MNHIKKQIFFVFFLSLIFIGGVPHVADAAVAGCQKLGGDTTVVTSIVKDNKGLQYLRDNSGQNYFDGVMPSVDNLPVYLAPDEMAACAQKVGDTVYLKGWYWNDNLGWISLYCPGDGGPNRGIPCGFVKYGVTLDNFGNFSGYAWSAVGWIRMTCKATPGFNDADICAQSAFKVKMAFGGPFDHRTAFPYTYAWSDTVGWVMMDSIRIPWNTIVDVLKVVVDPPITPQCIAGGLANPDLCLREKDITPDEALVMAGVNPGGGGNGPGGGLALKDVSLKPGVVNPGDDFPVTWNKIQYLGNNAVGSAGGLKALNPVTQADVRNLVYRNVVKWKKVASTSCGNNGEYLMNFSATDQVFYCKGDVHLNAAANKWKGNKTVIVEDGNVYIENNLYSDSGQFGIIALRNNLSSSVNGNVFVYPAVREMRVQIYADGYVLPANTKGSVASGTDYAISGNNDTLFGQLYVRGMIISGNSGSYGADGSIVAPSDLSALRSVPANPVDVTTAIKWSDYFTAVETGIYNAKADKKITDATGKVLYDIDPNTDAPKKIEKKVELKTKLSTDDVKKLKTVKIPSSDKLKADPATYSVGVILQFEPPASALGGFEGTLGNAYRQTR